MSTRRKFLAVSVSAVAGALAPSASARSHTAVESGVSEVADLCGEWLFRTDPENSGTHQEWFGAHARAEDWRRVSVPHTWQVQDPLTGYRGIAWYWRLFEVPATWQESAVRIEFEAVFHTATVWVNGS